MTRRTCVLCIAAATVVSFWAGCMTEEPPVGGPAASAPRVRETRDESPADVPEVRVEPPAVEEAASTADAERPDAAAGESADEAVALASVLGESDAKGEDENEVDDDERELGGGNYVPTMDAKLFEGWPKPQLVLVVSGEQDGYIEPCGCAGKENTKGGLSRRHTFLRQLAERGWEVVALDLGNQVRRYGRQQAIKFHSVVDGLRTMQYDAIGYGPDDLRLPTGELVSDAESGFVSANVGLIGPPGEVTRRYRIVERGGRKVGVTAVLGDSFHGQINNSEIVMLPAEPALAETLAELEAEKCDLLVLLSHAKQEESQALARKFPQFDLVVTADGAEEPPMQPATVEGTDAPLVEVGHKGMYLAAVGLFDDEDAPLRFQRVPLDARFADSSEMVLLMSAYQDQLQSEGLKGLEIRPVPHPTGHEFVGSEKCGECHTKAFEKWSQTPHATALDTLVELEPPRTFDAECLSCHVVGWEPQRYVPFASGYLGLQDTPHLAHNGCENCHGPGSAHVRAEEEGAEAPLAEQLRGEMRAVYAHAEANCVQCHDHDNSPAFKFDEYWKQVEHKGKD